MTQKTCKPCCDWSEPISQKLARFSESELAFTKACTYDHSLLGKRAHFWKLASLFTLWNTMSWLSKQAYQSSQSHVANVKASSLWKPARFLVKWPPGTLWLRRGDFVMWCAVKWMYRLIQRHCDYLCNVITHPYAIFQLRFGWNSVMVQSLHATHLIYADVINNPGRVIGMALADLLK